MWDISNFTFRRKQLRVTCENRKIERIPTYVDMSYSFQFDVKSFKYTSNIFQSCKKCFSADTQSKTMNYLRRQKCRNLLKCQANCPFVTYGGL